MSNDYISVDIYDLVQDAWEYGYLKEKVADYVDTSVDYDVLASKALEWAPQWIINMIDSMPWGSNAEPCELGHSFTEGVAKAITQIGTPQQSGWRKFQPQVTVALQHLLDQGAVSSLLANDEFMEDLTERVVMHIIHHPSVISRLSSGIVGHISGRLD